MKLALITCSKHPNGVKEDHPLFDALTHQQIDYELKVWDQPTDWSAFDIALIRSTWDYHEKSQEFLDWCNTCGNQTRLINPPEVIKWNSQKTYLKELAEKAFPIAPTLWIKQNSTPEIATTCTQIPGQKWFLKPIVGADSSGTLRFNIDDMATAQQHLNHWLKKTDMMLQPYLAEVESKGEVSLIYFGKHYSHAVIKKPQPSDYRVQNTYGAIDKNHQPSSQEQIICDAVIDWLSKRFKNICYTRIDLLFDKNNQPLINEVELIEPSLFFHHNHHAANLLIEQILKLA